jgi:hypothetical protein
LNRSHQQGHRGAASTDGNHLLAYYRNNLPTAHYSLSGVDKDSNFVTDGHAVVLIGYDNQRRSWLVQSSWGPAFADRGSYWVSDGRMMRLPQAVDAAAVTLFCQKMAADGDGHDLLLKCSLWDRHG